MPGWRGETPVVTGSGVTFYFIGASGARRSTGLSRIATSVTVAELDTLADALGGATNMGLFKWSGSGVTKYISPGNATVYDEAYSEGESLVMTFTNINSQNTYSPRIPAPEAAMFDGVLLDESNAKASALITAYQTILNELEAGWQLTKAYVSTAKPKERRSLPNIVEPGTGSPEEPPASA
jgi:hypothetical protein